MSVDSWQIHDTECAQYAADLIRQTCLDEALEAGPHYLHADNGTAMKAANLFATLQRLGVIPSFSRPGVSNDNPYSESLFRTVKYCPRYPERPFDTLEHARLWMGEFTDWYNHQHLHSGIRFVTPANVIKGRISPYCNSVTRFTNKAEHAHPERWSGNTRDWSRSNMEALNPPDNSANCAELSRAS